MTDVRTDARNYREFFEKQKHRASALDRRGQSIRIGIAVALFGALLFLKSPIQVWVWVAFLYGVTWYGLHRLRKALTVTVAALSSLEDVARFLGTLPPPSRAAVIDFVSAKVNPNDDSDVPEALSAFYSGQQNSESVRAVANSAFSLPSSELSVAQFFRTALVLGGLFGTVLFFAVELGGSGILAGDVATLLPGLQGALASTLTGILGSVAVGYLSSAIDQVIERSIWETESLIGGPFAHALQTTSQEKTAVNEVQLWQQLIEEVRKLRLETNESYAKVANDIAGHSIALQTLSTQLTELPAVQVPPQLASLDDVVRRFRDGTELLNTSATTLVNAVGTLGVYAPAKTLQELEAVRQLVTSAQIETARALQDVTAGIGSAKRELSVEIDGVRAVTAALAPALVGLESKVDNVQYEVGGTAKGLTALKETAERTEQSLYVLHERVVNATTAQVSPGAATGRPDRPRTEPILDIYRPERANPSSVVKEVSTGAERLAERVVALEAIEETMTQRAAALASKLDELSEQHRALGTLNRRLAAILSWQERAARAPLMKFLTLPFARARQVGRPDGA